jgi:hypothetical protein
MNKEAKQFYKTEGLEVLIAMKSWKSPFENDLWDITGGNEP